jgi:hypothetical protein
MTPFADPLTVRRMTPPGSEGYVRPSALLSINASEEEDVELIWTHTVDGRSFVSGYRLVPKLPLGLRRIEHD